MPRQTLAAHRRRVVRAGHGLVALGGCVLLGCSSGATEAPGPPSAATVAQPAAAATSALRAEQALLSGHTGIAGFTLSGDGSTLFLSTERYDGGPTHFVMYAIDLRTADARPVRVREGDGGPYLSPRGASDDGQFVLGTFSDGLHRLSREGASDVLVPESASYWFSPAISADGGTIAYARDGELRVFDVASARLERVALPPDSSAGPYAVLDARTILVGGSGAEGAWLRRMTVGGPSVDVCTGCSLGHVARTARLETSDDGSLHLFGPDGERAVGQGNPAGLSANGRVVARVEHREPQPYEYEPHLVVSGLTAPIDRRLGESPTTFAELAVGDDGAVVAEAAVRGADPRTPDRSVVSCLVVLHPHARVVACEPCDTTVEHCR